MLRRAIFALGLFACAPSSRAHMGDLEAVLADRAYPTSGTEATLADRLRRPLDVEAAAAVAILQNRELRAELESLGVWEPDAWVSALLPNPVASGGILLPAHPNEPGAGTKLEGALTIDLVRLLILGPRRSAALARLEAEKLKVAEHARRLIIETKRTFFDLVAIEETLDAQKAVVEAASAAAEFAERQRQSGAASELEAAQHRIASTEAALELSRLELQRTETRARLSKLLGVEDAQLVRPLPALPAAEIPLEAELDRALEKRLDLAAARADLEASERAEAAAAWMRIPELRAGAGLEREIDGHLVIGPTVQVALPIFDHNQAEVARLEAHVRTAKERRAAIEQEVKIEVRSARARLELARRTAEYYRDQVLPLRARIVELSQRQYNQMQLGVFELLRSKKSETESRRQSIEALRDYWRARVDLEQALGVDVGPKKEAK